MKTVAMLPIVMAAMLLSCGDSGPSEPSPHEQTLKEERVSNDLKLGIAAMRGWLTDDSSRGDQDIAEIQECMQDSVRRHVETLDPNKRRLMAARLMQFMDQQTNLGFDLYQSGEEGCRIAARYAKLRGRLCQLMGNVPRAMAEYESCLEFLKMDDPEARRWRNEVKEMK